MKKFNFNYLFITLAAIAQGMMWVNLFSLIHHGWLAYIGGIPAGFAIVGILTRSANILPRVQSKRARNAGWVMLVLVLAIEPVVLGVVNWWFMPADLQKWFISYIMAGGASLAVSFALVLGALVDRSLVAVENKPVAQVAETVEKPPRKEGKVAKERPATKRKTLQDAEIIAFFQGNEGASDTEAAQHFGVSRQAIGQRRKKLFEVRKG